MTQRYIKDLRTDDEIDQIVKIVASSVNGYIKAGQNKRRLDLTLQDCTGRIAAVQWDPNDRDVTAAKEAEYATMRGLVKIYHGVLQVTVSKFAPLAELPVNLADYEWSPSEPIGEMRKRLDALIVSVQEPNLRALLNAVFQNPKVRDAFEYAPAALKVHHAFEHGLLQHTLEVADFADAIASISGKWRGSDVSRDLAVTAALLHDIGKIQEFDYADDSPRQTRIGQLLGHVTLGYTRVASFFNKVPGMPMELKEALLHIILAHHGKKEFGSPVTPMFPEALIVSMADDMSAKLHIMFKAQEEAVETEFVKAPFLESQSIYVGSRGISETIVEAAPTFSSTTATPLAFDPSLTQLPMAFDPSLTQLPIYQFATKKNTLEFTTRKIAFYGEVAAGYPRDVAGSPLEEYTILADGLNPSDQFFLLEIDGESMTGDGLNPGDKVLVRKQETAQNGDIVIVWFNDDRANVKHFHKSATGEVSLLSSNPKFDPITIPDPASIQIHGRVIGVMQG